MDYGIFFLKAFSANSVILCHSDHTHTQRKKIDCETLEGAIILFAHVSRWTDVLKPKKKKKICFAPRHSSSTDVSCHRGSNRSFLQYNLDASVMASFEKKLV